MSDVPIIPFKANADKLSLSDSLRLWANEIDRGLYTPRAVFLMMIPQEDERPQLFLAGPLSNLELAGCLHYSLVKAVE